MYKNAAETEGSEEMETKIKTVETGPPPDFAKRHLIFDSLQKIIGKSFARGGQRGGGKNNTRGTYIYTWGAGYHSQLGRKFLRGQKKYATVPRRVEMNCAVRQVDCGGLHTAAVTDMGTVFTWGDARGSQLGYQPQGFSNQTTPFEVEALSNYFITKVACGQIHTVAVTDKGHLLSWGLSKFGQCGHGDRQTVKYPKMVSLQHGLRFQDISCGDRHTAALSAEGEVYTFGCGEHGQLGHGDDRSISGPTKIEALVGHNIISVVCGSIHTCFVTDTGDLYVCGFGEYFYPNEDQNFFYVPVKIPFKERVAQVACGQSHIIALTDKGDVYCWGSGSYGQLGHGVKGNLSVPRLVLTGKSIAQVAAGRYHSIALTSYGVLYSWGCGENGQLGHHDDNNVLFPRVVEPNIGTVVGQIACGEHHTAVLTSTPWNRVDPEVAEWISLDQEEYERKLTYLKKTNHGLFKKDLVQLQEEMKQVKAEREEYRSLQKQREDKEMQDDIRSIWSRDQIQANLDSDKDITKLVEVGDDVELPSTESELKRTQRRKGSRLIVAGERKKQIANLGLSPRGGDNSDTIVTKTLPASGSQTERTRGVGNGMGMGQRAVFLKESAQMVQRMKQIIAETGENSNEAQLKRMLTLTYEYRKEYDALKAITNQKAKSLLENKQAIKALKRNNIASNDRTKFFDTRVKALEMKLNTVTIKITETEENRKNYALNIAHLKEEELERYYQLEALRKQCAEYDAFCKKLNEMKLQSLEEKDRAETELAAFQVEIRQFQNFITDQIGKFENISTVSRQRTEKRELEKDKRTKIKQEKIAGRILKLNGLMDEKNKEATSMSQQLESVNERLRYFEKRFQQIASATGLTNPDAIINKYALKEEIKSELNTEIASKENRAKELDTKLEELRGEKAELSSNYTDSKWKDVHELQNELTSWDAVAAKHKKDADNLEQTLIYFQECLYNLNHDLGVQTTNGADVAMAVVEEGTFSRDLTLNCLASLDERLNFVLVRVSEIEAQEAENGEYEAKVRASEELLRNLPGFNS